MNQNQLLSVFTILCLLDTERINLNIIGKQWWAFLSRLQVDVAVLNYTKLIIFYIWIFMQKMVLFILQFHDFRVTSLEGQGYRKEYVENLILGGRLSPLSFLRVHSAQQLNHLPKVPALRRVDPPYTLLKREGEKLCL